MAPRSGSAVVTTDVGRLRARAVIVATGARDELPAIPGLAERWGTTVLHCPYCHGWEVRDRRLGVLVTSPPVLHLAELIRRWSGQVTVFTALIGPLDAEVSARLRSRGVTLVDEPVEEVLGEGSAIRAVRLADGREVPLEAIFTAGRLRPQDQFLAHLGLARTESPMGSFLAVDPTGRTSAQRIWAIGNVVNPAANVPMSIGAGAFTGGAVNGALVAEEFDAAMGSAASTGHAGSAGRGGTSGCEGGVRGTESGADPAEFWEQHYAGEDAVWSGRPNRALVDVVSGLHPGRALDLGSGEGADAIWLAARGWEVTGVDISATAVGRAAAAARESGVEARLRFVVADLGQDGQDHGTEGPFDLVTANFFQAPVALDRTRILRRVAAQVATAGHLLITSHAAPPPWASGSAEHDHGHDHGEGRGPVFLRPEEEVSALELDRDAWTVEICEVREREATGPDGQPALLEDSVVLLRRL